MNRINVSYPFKGAFNLDGLVGDVVGAECVGAGCGSYLLSFSGAESGTWRDLEFVTGRTVADIEKDLKQAQPHIDWRVGLMPEVD